MKTLRFFANAAKPEAEAARRRLVAEAEALGFSVVPDDACAADAVVAIGGDGTFLRAVHEFPEVPVLGLNLGGLGYLASIGEADFGEALASLAAGRYSVSERRLIEADGRFAALNDIVLTRELSGHAARLDLFADGRLVTRYMADGLIFATPTGSTAYSLAAGGPVLMPDTSSFVITPMNPHALGVRPLVIADKVRLRIAVRSRTDGNCVKVGVYADGENVGMLGDGETVEIAKSEKTAKIIELEGYDPYAVLARKLGWSGSNVT